MKARLESPRVIEVPLGTIYLRCCQCKRILQGRYIDTGNAAICLTCPLPSSEASESTRRFLITGGSSVEEVFERAEVHGGVKASFIDRGYAQAFYGALELRSRR